MTLHTKWSLEVLAIYGLTAIFTQKKKKIIIEDHILN